MVPSDGRNTTISDVLEHLIDVLERTDPSNPTPFSRSMQGTGRPFRADYGFSIRQGLGSSDPSAGNRDGRLVDIRRTDDGMNVVADLPGVDGTDVTVRADEAHRALEIGTDEGVLERISLPWPATVRTVRFNNGVLDVDLAPRDRDDE